MKTQIVPVVIGALGVVKKGIEKEIDTGKHQCYRIAKDRSIRVSAHPTNSAVNEVEVKTMALH